MATQQVREPLVTIKNDKIKAEAKVAATAVPHYVAAGWTADKSELAEAEKALTATESGETTTRASKKTTNGN